MEFVRKAIVTAVIGCMPIVIAALINMFAKQEVFANELYNLKSEFLRTVLRVETRLERIENKIDERYK